MKKKLLKILLSVLCIASLILSVASITWGTNHASSDSAYFYKTDASGVKYSVNLVPNDFYEDLTQGMGKQYLSSLVKDIDLEMPFEYSSSDLANIQYDYRVTGTIIGEYKTTNGKKAQIWDREYVISDTKSEKLENATSFSIKPKYVIDFPKYVNIVENYKTQNHVTIDATLRVKMAVNYSVQSKAGDFSDSKNVEVLIPLTQSAFNINFEGAEAKDLIGGDVHMDWRFIIGGIACIAASIASFAILFFGFLHEPKRKYDAKLDKILRDYSDIIAEVEGKIDLDDEKVFELSSFDDLVDVEAEVKSPILFYEISAGKRSKSEFVVLKEDKAFRFVLKG